MQTETRFHLHFRPFDYFPQFDTHLLASILQHSLKDCCYLNDLPGLSA